ncbi:hypothetical protein Ddye_007757 [Dipteronia dyeriana]|uniref:Reverse transcriptase zinc-binding domain-containing protein n=1 Tax=Dipteronia dyeriana TaxID=168575 RepID=A0AAE0CRZ6_9ROSI|nr:hypothetical protein Ddye_007757 [Dipteronia dyeriana]
MKGDDSTVDDLKLPSGLWNESLIRQFFLPEDASLILRIPCSSHISDDVVSWHYEKYGTYTVKSGYHLGMSLSSTMSSSGLCSLESWWKYLWRFKVPSKFKLLIWRAYHDWIPINSNLAKCGVVIDGLCPMCRQWPGTTLYALWYCFQLRRI